MGSEIPLWEKCGILPTLVLDGRIDPGLLVDLLQASSFPALEILHRQAHTWKVLAELRKRAPALAIGVGTLLSEEDLRRAAGEGASFGVSPGLDERLVAKARDLRLLYLPGVSTASEVMQALRWECSYLKFFPAAALGSAYLAQLAAAFPQVRWIPSGGLSTDTWKAFAALPSVACVSGSWMLGGESSEATFQELQREAHDLGLFHPTSRPVRPT